MNIVITFENKTISNKLEIYYDGEWTYDNWVDQRLRSHKEYLSTLINETKQ